jgi:hypothetical protein
MAHISKSYENDKLFAGTTTESSAFNSRTCWDHNLEKAFNFRTVLKFLQILWHHRGLPISRPSGARGPERWCEDERSEDEHHLSAPLLSGSEKGVPQMGLSVKESCQLNDFSNF